MSAFAWIQNQCPDNEDTENRYGIELKERGYTLCKCLLSQVEFFEDDELIVVQAFGSSERDRFIYVTNLEEARVFPLKDGFRPASGFFKWPHREKPVGSQ